MNILDSIINTEGKLWWPFALKFSCGIGEFDFTESFPGATRTEAIREIVNNYDMTEVSSIEFLSYSPLDNEEGF